VAEGADARVARLLSRRAGFPAPGRRRPFAPAPFQLLAHDPRCSSAPRRRPVPRARGASRPGRPCARAATGTQASPALARAPRDRPRLWGLPSPETGTLLAELGAEVIKIESRANIDFLRRVTVEPDAVDRSWTFNDASRGQLSVAPSILRAPPAGREAWRSALCAAADDRHPRTNRGDVVWQVGPRLTRDVRPQFPAPTSSTLPRRASAAVDRSARPPAYGPAQLRPSSRAFTWLWKPSRRAVSPPASALKPPRPHRRQS